MKNLLDSALFFFAKDKEFRTALYKVLGFYPHNVEIYRIAFAHKSQEYRSRKQAGKSLNNERLEFLGDSVLGTVVSDILYRKFPNKREGFLTNTRSKIVSRESLGTIAAQIGIERFLQSHTSHKTQKSYLAGNTFEALIGAIFLDRGFSYVYRFVETKIIGTLIDLESVAHKEVNFKSKLLEWGQKNRIRIDFKEKSNNGEQGATFSTTIVIEGLFAGEGSGFTKKDSHQAAAKDALTKLRAEEHFHESVYLAKEKRTAMGADECFVLPKIDEIEAEIAQPKNDKKLRAKGENPKPQHDNAKPRNEAGNNKTDNKKNRGESDTKTQRDSQRETREKTTRGEKREDKTQQQAPQTERKNSDKKENSNATNQAEKGTDLEASTPEMGRENIPTEAEKKRARRHNQRQNAADFTNTTLPPAEQSKRAEKAARRVEQEKHERMVSQSRGQLLNDEEYVANTADNQQETSVIAENHNESSATTSATDSYSSIVANEASKAETAASVSEVADTERENVAEATESEATSVANEASEAETAASVSEIASTECENVEQAIESEATSVANEANETETAASISEVASTERENVAEATESEATSVANEASETETAASVSEVENSERENVAEATESEATSVANEVSEAETAASVSEVANTERENVAEATESEATSVANEVSEAETAESVSEVANTERENVEQAAEDEMFEVEEADNDHDDSASADGEKQDAPKRNRRGRRGGRNRRRSKENSSETAATENEKKRDAPQQSDKQQDNNARSSQQKRPRRRSNGKGNRKPSAPQSPTNDGDA